MRVEAAIGPWAGAPLGVPLSGGGDVAIRRGDCVLDAHGDYQDVVVARSTDGNWHLIGRSKDDEGAAVVAAGFGSTPANASLQALSPSEFINPVADGEAREPRGAGGETGSCLQAWQRTGAAESAVRARQRAGRHHRRRLTDGRRPPARLHRRLLTLILLALSLYPWSETVREGFGDGTFRTVAFVAACLTYGVVGISVVLMAGFVVAALVKTARESRTSAEASVPTAAPIRERRTPAVGELPDSYKRGV